ncbi:MAG TPA: molybdopterin dinucleotide binding domain-containing protein, partial [Candidatus Binataceae bacterium]|nr:molybdopterin dinucleotide binding domain-containing protein [Candidatus Binataceae bacterium]
SRKHLIGVGYYVGPRMSLTAAKSDYYLKCRPGTEATVALGILRSMNDQGLLKHVDNQEVLKRFVAPFAPEQVERQSGVSARQLGLMAKDFGSARSALALAAGDDPALHTAIYIINALSGNLNNTLFFSKTPSPSLIPQSQRTTAALLEAIRSHEVDVLIVADANPAFSMSSALEFASMVRHVPSVVWCGSVPDETAELAHLLLPIHHTLEDWSDAEVRTSIRTLGQPVMQPVFNSHSLGDILLDTARMAGGTPRWPDIRAAVEDHWSSLASHESNHPSFAQFWDDARRNGGFFTKIQPTPVQLSRTVFQQPMQIPSSDEKATTLVAYPHVFFYDGRGADKPWLQENPEPVSQLVWDSWVEIHPDTAKALEIHDDDLVEIKSSHGAIELPAKLDHGVQAQTIAVPLGQGHSSFGRYATGRGANPWPILPPDSLRVSVKLRRTGKHHKLVSPLFTANMMHRPIVEKISLDDVKNGHRPADEEPPPPKPYELWPEHVYKKHHWGMTIDVNSCTGCGACVTACYAENNLNVVGREGVRMGRIMSWLRVERYFPEDLDSPQIYLMPMLCQQCDHAPCEPVCPVYASSHTEEGLNAQVYNRCVGTRYCENNCPYKVRRFNWFRPEFAEPLHLQLNPDVTVRGEGVMEKCTFCIQRIRAAEITATVEDRALHDGEIIPACAQTCPSEAIIFGDILDPHSKMMLRRKEHHIRNYRALEELNTKPSIVYLRTIYRPREV